MDPEQQDLAAEAADALTRGAAVGGGAGAAAAATARSAMEKRRGGEGGRGGFGGLPLKVSRKSGGGGGEGAHRVVVHPQVGAARKMGGGAAPSVLMRGGGRGIDNTAAALRSLPSPASSEISAPPDAAEPLHRRMIAASNNSSGSSKNHRPGSGTARKKKVAMMMKRPAAPLLPATTSTTANERIVVPAVRDLCGVYMDQGSDFFRPGVFDDRLGGWYPAKIQQVELISTPSTMNEPFEVAAAKAVYELTVTSDFFSGGKPLKYVYPDPDNRGTFLWLEPSDEDYRSLSLSLRGGGSDTNNDNNKNMDRVMFQAQPETLEIGDLVFARFRAGDKWHRGRVMDVYADPEGHSHCHRHHDHRHHRRRRHHDDTEALMEMNQVMGDGGAAATGAADAEDVVGNTGGEEPRKEPLLPKNLEGGADTAGPPASEPTPPAPPLTPPAVAATAPVPAPPVPAPPAVAANAPPPAASNGPPAVPAVPAPANAPPAAAPPAPLASTPPAAVPAVPAPPEQTPPVAAPPAPAPPAPALAATPPATTTTATTARARYPRLLCSIAYDGGGGTDRATLETHVPFQEGSDDEDESDDEFDSESDDDDNSSSSDEDNDDEGTGGRFILPRDRPYVYMAERGRSDIKWLQLELDRMWDGKELLPLRPNQQVSSDFAGAAATSFPGSSGVVLPLSVRQLAPPEEGDDGAGAAAKDPSNEVEFKYFRYEDVARCVFERAIQRHGKSLLEFEWTTERRVQRAGASTKKRKKNVSSKPPSKKNNKTSKRR